MSTETLPEKTTTTTTPHIPRPRKSQPPSARRWVIPAVAVAVLLVVAVGAVIATMSRKEADLSGLTFTVAEGPLTISVSESGTIKSRQQEIIKSELEGQNTILFLIPEGTMVKKGDLLVELDASRLVDSKIERQIQVQNAEAAFIRAREQLEVAKSQATSDIAQAEIDFRFAKEDLQKYLNGDYPNEKKQAENKITIANEEATRAADKLEWSHRLFSEKYVSETELRADEIAEKKAQLELELAREALKLLEEYTFKRRVAELESNVKQTEMALDRVKRKASADVVQAEADNVAKQLEFERQKAQLDKLVDQINKAKMYAPTDGLVVYSTTGRGGWRGNEEPLAEGQQVRERQDIINLPTATDVMAEIKVHESSLDKVRVGLPVRIMVDALPGRTFYGRVSRIAPLPDAQSAFMNPDLKVFTTEIIVSGDGSALRTGMSCRAEIIVDRYEKATYIPVQSVLRVGNQPTAYVVKDGGTIESRPIEIGMDNNRMVRVISGLQLGERVLLSPPLQDAAAVDRFDDAEATTQPAMENIPPLPAAPPQRVPRGDGGPRNGDGGEGAGEMRGEGRGPGGEGRGERGATGGEGRRRMPAGFENMTEEREKLRQQFQQQQGGQGGGNE